MPQKKFRRLRTKTKKPLDTIIVFDIRNFSEHRWRLANEGHASLLTKFVNDVLNNAVELLENRRKEFDLVPEPILNHTGDGFVLILRGPKNPFLAILWISEFQRSRFVKN